MNATNATILEQAKQLHQLGVKRIKIAEKFGVHRNTITAWLNGKNVPMADYRPNQDEAPAPDSARGKQPKTEQTTDKDATRRVPDTKKNLEVLDGGLS